MDTGNFAVDSGFHELDSRLPFSSAEIVVAWSHGFYQTPCEWNLDFEFQLDALSVITDSKAQDFRFQNKYFLNSGIRIAL